MVTADVLKGVPAATVHSVLAKVTVVRVPIFAQVCRLFCTVQSLLHLLLVAAAVMARS